MNKKGISLLVTTVLTILITVAGVAVVWVGVVPMIKNNLEVENLDFGLEIVTSDGYTVYDEINDLVSVQVRQSGKDEIGKIKIIIDFDGNSVSHIEDAPGIGITKVYFYNLSEFDNYPRGVRVAPIFSVEDNEKEGVVISEAVFSKGSFDEEIVEDAKSFVDFGYNEDDSDEESGETDEVVDYDDVLLIINENSEDSVYIGNYFAEQRGIANILSLSVSDNEFIVYEDFVSDIKNPVGEYLDSYDGEINYIVTTKGVPLKHGVNSGISCGEQGFYKSHASVDSELTLIRSDLEDFIGGCRNVNNPYKISFHYDLNDHFYSEDFGGIKLVTRLTGYNRDDVIDLIDRASDIDNDGTVIIDKGGGFATQNNMLNDTYNILIGEGLDAYLEDSGFFLDSYDGEVIGYVSWGSNGAGYGDSSVPKPSFNWANGAVAETFVSTSARSFSEGTTYGQSLIADLIADGVSGVSGYVYEPYTSSLIDTRVSLDAYFDGYNFAESFYMGKPSLSWMGVVVGDPKMSLEAFDKDVSKLSPPLIFFEGETDVIIGSEIKFSVQDYNLNADSTYYKIGDEIGNFVKKVTHGSFRMDYSLFVPEMEEGVFEVSVFAEDFDGRASEETFEFNLLSSPVFNGPIEDIVLESEGYSELLDLNDYFDNVDSYLMYKWVAMTFPIVYSSFREVGGDEQYGDSNLTLVDNSRVYLSYPNGWTGEEFVRFCSVEIAGRSICSNDIRVEVV